MSAPKTVSLALLPHLPGNVYEEVPDGDPRTVLRAFAADDPSCSKVPRLRDALLAVITASVEQLDGGDESGPWLHCFPCGNGDNHAEDCPVGAAIVLLGGTRQTSPQELKRFLAGTGAVEGEVRGE